MKDWILDKWWKKTVYVMGYILFVLYIVIPFMLGFFIGLLE